VRSLAQLIERAQLGEFGKTEEWRELGNRSKPNGFSPILCYSLPSTGTRTAR
jgi:hypothetical protein